MTFLMHTYTAPSIVCVCVSINKVLLCNYVIVPLLPIISLQSKGMVLKQGDLASIIGSLRIPKFKHYFLEMNAVVK